MKLFQRSTAPSLRPMEIPASFVSRLAAWLRYTTAAAFCREFELDFEMISSGDVGQLRKLAALTNVDIGDLRHGPVRSGGRFAVAGHTLSTSQLDRVDLWICPECAIEDIRVAPHLPAEAAIAVQRDYVVRAIGTCSRHRRRLVWVERTSWLGGRHDTSLLTSEAAGRLDKLLAASELAEPSPIDLFVRNRLDGKIDDQSFLGRLSLFAVLQLSGRLGNLALNGGLPNLRKMTRPELNSVYSAGIGVLQGGAPAIEKLVIDHDEHARSMERSATGKAMLAPKVWRHVVESLDEPGLQLIHGALANAAKKVRRARQPRVKALNTVAEQYGVGLPAARAFAEQAEAVHPGNANRVDAEALARWIEAGGGMVPSWKAAQEIGATRKQMRELLHSGLLSPVNGIQARQGAFNWLRRNEVEQLMRRFTQDAEECRSIPAGKALIFDAVQGFAGALPKVHEAISDKTIWVGKLTGALPYASILVDPDQVFELLQSPTAKGRQEEFLSPMEFARACGIGSVAGHALVVKKVVRAEVRLNKVTGFKRASVPASEVERFHSEFVTGTNLARALGIRTRDVVAFAAKRGATPVVLQDVALTLFRRADLVGILPD